MRATDNTIIREVAAPVKQDGGGFFMDEVKVTFYLQTTSAIFLDWCWRYTSSWYLRYNFTRKTTTIRFLGGGYRNWLENGGNRRDHFGLRAAIYSETEDGDGERCTPIGEVIEFQTMPLAADRIEVQAVCCLPAAENLFAGLLQAIGERWPESGLVKEEKPGRGGEEAEDRLSDAPKGPTEETIRRAYLYRKLKEACPKRTLNAVAIQAGLLEPDAVPTHTGKSVRNAYRAMGWTWERGDRVR